MSRNFVGRPQGLVIMQGLRNGWVVGFLAAAWMLGNLGLAQDVQRVAARKKSRSKSAAAERDTGDQATDKNTSADADQKSVKKDQPGLSLRDVIKYAEPSRAALQDVEDYTAVFSKTELVKGKLIKQEMDMKFRKKPFSVFFKYRKGPEAGRIAIYVDGKFDNKLVVKEANGLGVLAGRMYLKLDDRKVMSENRYPVTSVGISNVLETSLNVWDRECRVDSAEIDVKFFPGAKLQDIPCEVVQITYQKELPDLKYHLVRVYFDKESKLPVGAERYGWPRKAGDKPPLLEEYKYTNVKINQRLTDSDFDPVRYGF